LHPGITVFNPGSVGIPKDGTHSYGVYEDGRFEFRVWDE
jgi:predicted phosphodiesterase